MVRTFSIILFLFFLGFSARILAYSTPNKEEKAKTRTTLVEKKQKQTSRSQTKRKCKSKAFSTRLAPMSYILNPLFSHLHFLTGQSDCATDSVGA